MYSSLNPLLATEKSEMKFSHRYSEEEEMAGGMLLPQYVPISGEVGKLPSRTCRSKQSINTIFYLIYLIKLFLRIKYNKNIKT